MKTPVEIEKRLASLYHKYENLYVKENLRHSPDNCVFNLTHYAAPLIPRSPDLEKKLAPRKQVTLLVIENSPQSVRLCTFGSEDPETWNGDMCDTDEHAQACPWFTPSETETQLREQFRELMLDDEYVFANYKDVMALQWATGHRIDWAHEEPEVLEAPGGPAPPPNPWHTDVFHWFFGLFQRSKELPP